jgi:hypothetical protein
MKNNTLKLFSEQNSKKIKTPPLFVSGEIFKNFLGKVEESFSRFEKDKTKKDAEEVVKACQQILIKNCGAKGYSLVQGNPNEKILLDKPNLERQDNLSNILVYGRVQSGKTNLAIASIALAYENGFRVFVYLTSDNVWLLEQTESRINEGLDTSKIRVRGKDDLNEEDVDQVVENTYLPNHAYVFVCNKNKAPLNALNAILKKANAYKYPAIVIDDEADNASLNTSIRKKITDPNFKDSPIYELINSCRRQLNHVFLQVTATPKALLLQSRLNPMRPFLTKKLEAGSGYMGGKLFFEPPYNHTIDDIDPLEVERLKNLHREIPDGLFKALCSFCISFAHGNLNRLQKNGIYSFLVHIDHKKITQHHLKRIAFRMQNLLVDKLLKAKKTKHGGKVGKILSEMYNDLKKTCDNSPGLPSFDRVWKELKQSVTGINTVVVNSDSRTKQPKYCRGMNILVGGNKLNRGVTIEGLTTTYYGRSAQRPQEDTIQQHARMYGYRKKLEGVTRLFMPENTFEIFERIHESEERQRESIENLEITPENIILVGKGLSPTRPSVIDFTRLTVIHGGVMLWPRRPMFKKRELYKSNYFLEKDLQPFTKTNRFQKARIEQLIKWIENMPNKPKRNEEWQHRHLKKVLNTLSSGVESKYGWVMYREQDSTREKQLKNQRIFDKGYIPGDWQQEAKRIIEQTSNEPALIIYKTNGKRSFGWDEFPVYLPALWLPKGQFTAIINESNNPKN